MACCVAIAVVIGILRAAWYRLVRRSSPPRTGLPPQARRPAPAAADSAAEGRVRAVAVAPSAVQASTRPSPVGAAALGAAVGVLLHVGMVELIRVAGLATIAPGTGLAPIRHQMLVVVAAALGAIVAWYAVRDATAMISRWPLAVGVAGGSWFGLSVIDMHVVGLVPAGGEYGAHAGHQHGAHGLGGHPSADGLPHLLFDVLFHGPGLALFAAAVVLSSVRRRPASARRRAGSEPPARFTNKEMTP